MICKRSVGIGIAAVHDLRSSISPPEGILDALPGTRFLGGHETVFSGGICAIGDTQKGVYAVELVASDFPKRGIRYCNVISDLKVLLLLVFVGSGSRGASAYGKWSGSKGGGTYTNFL